jgi:hypothetical protein
MIATHHAALVIHKAACNHDGCSPDREFQAGWEAAMRTMPTTSTEWGIRHVPNALYDDEYVDVFIDEKQARGYLSKYLSNPNFVGSQIVTRTVTEWENAHE